MTDDERSKRMDELAVKIRETSRLLRRGTEALEKILEAFQRHEDERR